MSKHPTAAAHEYRVPFDGDFSIDDAPTEPPKDGPDREACEQKLAQLTARLDKLQHAFYADGGHALLCVFQAMDAAGKDSTVRAVFSGVDPAGCGVHAFKQPSTEELAHDFLWRAATCLPARGQIGVFNRSYYEDCLIVRVHPEMLRGRAQTLPKHAGKFWDQRFESIRNFEKHLARNGTVVIKFFLHVSKSEQRRRFLARLDEPAKNWKFSEGDVRERELWDDYQKAYEEALAATSRKHAPWYAIPADDKLYMRMTVAEIVVETLEKLDPQYPQLDEHQLGRFAVMRRYLKKR